MVSGVDQVRKPNGRGVADLGAGRFDCGLLVIVRPIPSLVLAAPATTALQSDLC